MLIRLGKKTKLLENIDILTPNRLIWGCNNNRNPTRPLEISGDFRRIIESNSKISQSWFQEWLIGYVPSLVKKLKWFKSEQNICIGDILLFMKFEQQYQYGIVVLTFVGRDGLIRTVNIEYTKITMKTQSEPRKEVYTIFSDSSC